MKKQEQRWMSQEQEQEQSQSESQDGQRSPKTPLQKYNFDLPWNCEENRAPVKLARELYFKEHTYDFIFEQTGIPLSVYRVRVTKQWAKLKKRLDEKLIDQLRKEVLSEKAGVIIKKASNVIDLYFTRLMKRGAEVGGKDAKFASDIIANIHRMQRLEEGKPTEISKIENMSQEEAMEYLRKLAQEQSKEHDMTMFGEDKTSEEELLAEYSDGNTH